MPTNLARVNTQSPMLSRRAERISFERTKAFFPTQSRSFYVGNFRASSRGPLAEAAIQDLLKKSMSPREARGYKLRPLDPRLLTYAGKVRNPMAFATADDVHAHAQGYIREAVFPEGRKKDDVGFYDFDGVCSIGGVALGRLAYEYANTRGFVYKGFKLFSRATGNYLLGKSAKLSGTSSSYLGVHISGATIYGGHSESELRTFMNDDLFEHAFMDQRFHQAPVPGEKEGEERYVPRPFIFRKLVESLMEREARGGVNVIATGSLRYGPEAIFAPRNISRLAKKFLNLDVPDDRPLVHFFIGACPSFKDGKGEPLATTIAQYPLTMGIGKLANARALCQVWGVDHTKVTVHTDDLLDLAFLTHLGNPDTQFATNVPADQRHLLEALELRTASFDDHARPITVQEAKDAELFAREYLEDTVREIAIEVNGKSRSPKAKKK